MPHGGGRVHIRWLTPADTPGFLRLKQIGLTTDPDSFVASLTDDSPSYAAQVQERLAHASIQSGDIVIGAFSDHLVGVTSVTRDRRTKRQHKADLHGMYIVPEFRGHGLGRALLTRVLEMARQMEGLEEIQLIVAVHNREAVSLYEQFGFEHVWTETHALKADDRYVDAHHMVLDLRDRSQST